jgi:hypothetical protein
LIQGAIVLQSRDDRTCNTISSATDDHDATLPVNHGFLEGTGRLCDVGGKVVDGAIAAAKRSPDFPSHAATWPSASSMTLLAGRGHLSGCFEICIPARAEVGIRNTALCQRKHATS